MKKVLLVGSIIVLTITGCGSGKDNEKNLISVEVSEDTQMTVQDIAEESETVSSTETQEITTEISEEKENSKANLEIGKTRTALADTGVEPLDLVGLPEGVASEFTYFDYNIGFDGMVKAQQYLEQIGVSEEGKKLIVLSEQSNRSASIHIEEYTFTDDTIYHIQHTFYSYDGSFEEAVSDYGADSIDYMDEEAYYIRSAATEESINFLRNYDNMVDSLNDQYRKVVW